MKIRPELGLLLAAVFLACLIGGQVQVDAMAGGGLVEALTGKIESVRLTRALLGLLVFAGLAWLLLSQRSVVLPKQKLLIGMAAVVGLLGAGIALAGAKFYALDSWLHWLVFAGVFGLAAGAVGRKAGPLAVALAAGAGASCAALRGIAEYVAIREAEPTYRIFAGWINPNAAASLFLMAAPLGVGVAVSQKGSHRWVGAGISLLCVCGLVLTQSRGGFLAAGVGLAAAVAMILLWKVEWKKLALPAAAILLGAGLAVGMQATAPKAGPGASLGRVAAGGQEAEQSAGFRTLLWRSAAQLTAERPWGWGPGAFRFEGARPGLITQTVNPHQSYLQLALEGGVLALIAFLAFAGLWLARVFSGAKALTEEQNGLRAGLVAGVLASAAHGMFESVFFHFGLGLLFFALMGTALLVSADGSSPELMPKPFRQAFAFLFCFVPVALLFLMARAEASKSSYLASIQSDGRATESAAASLESLAKLDGETAYLLAAHGPISPESRLEYMRLAATLQPSTRMLRALARAEEQAGQPMAALAALDRVLQLDPNNLPGLLLKLRISEAAGRPEEAAQAAQKLVGAESSTTFRIRALADLVPTETFQARLWLADRSDASAARRIELLEPAVAGFREYKAKTITQIERMGGLGYAGQDRRDALEAMKQGQRAASLLADALRAEGRDSKEAESAGAEFGAEADRLSRALTESK